MSNTAHSGTEQSLGVGTQNANISINGGTFNTVHGDLNRYEVYQHTTPTHESGECYQSSWFSPQIGKRSLGIVLLSQRIAHGAMHDSAERYPPGRCHPGTRERIINVIMEWICHPDPPSSILWVRGSAGVGKSAIMQTIAELLREEPPGRYAGSFFFARGIAGRNSGEALFSTLAYQIAKNIPGMQAHVDDAMNADQTLTTKSMDIQLQSLIIGPLSRFGGLTHIPTVIIDGLDECLGSRNQRAILSLIAKARTISHVPLRFLIASRPEFCICDTFDKKPLFDITKQVSLTDSTNNWDADKDIDTYLRDGFAKIYEENSDVMDDAQWPWPSEEIVSNFVKKSSGQFIYASTVLRFVGEASDFDSPQTQLEIITSPGPLRGRAFSDLDQLYTLILSVYPRPDTLLRVLGGLLVNGSLEALEIITDVSMAEIKMVLRAIASLVYLNNGRTLVTDENADDDKELETVYGHKSYFSFCHLSFREFLEDKSRSRSFYIDTQTLHDDIFGKVFDAMGDSLKGKTRHSELMFSQAWSDMYHGSPPRLYLQASHEKIQNCVDRLQWNLQQFNFEGNFTVSQAKSLLRHMSIAERLLISLLSKFKPLITAILPKIRAIQDSSIRYLLSISSPSLLEFLSYFMATWDDEDRYAGLLFSRICYLRDFSVCNDAWARAFLTQNAHFFERSGVEGEYRPLVCLSNFLRSPSRGVTFHIEFRAHCIKTCERFLLQLPLTDIGASPHIYWSVEEFFTDPQISSIKNDNDIFEMEGLINILYNYDWSQFHQSSGFRHFWALRVFEWIHDQLNNLGSPILLLPEDLRTKISEKMLDIMLQIYHGPVASLLSETPFSDDLCVLHNTYMRSVRLTLGSSAIKGDITENDSNMSFADINAIRITINDYFSTLSTITPVLKHPKYCQVIAVSHWSTLAAEFYLHMTAKTQYHRFRPEFKSYSRLLDATFATSDFDFWILHANPTEKILLALRAIKALCYKASEKWQAPYGFCSLVVGLLQKFHLDGKECSDFYLWLDDLKRHEKL